MINKTTKTWQLLPVTAPEQAEPGLILYRFAHSMYYANAQQLFDQVIGLVEGAKPSLTCFCIDASAVADVDFSAAETLREIYDILKSRGIRFIWVNVTDLVKTELDRYEITELFGKDAFYENISDVIAVYKKGDKLSL